MIVGDLMEQDKRLAVRYVITGTQAKEFMGVPSAGRQIELPGISILHFRKGLCVERWVGSDSMLLLHQISGRI